MKAYLTTIGERTTEICKSQLEKFGFEVIMLDEYEQWLDKYKKFILLASEDGNACIRIDADTIPNKNIVRIRENTFDGILMSCFLGYDFYKNDIGVISPVYYSANALQIIRKNLDKIGKFRPETDASRLPEINPQYEVIDWIIGIHGFFQDFETIERARSNKIQRKQNSEYDFDLVNQIISLD